MSVRRKNAAKWVEVSVACIEEKATVGAHVDHAQFKGVTPRFTEINNTLTTCGTDACGCGGKQRLDIGKLLRKTFSV